VRIRAARPWELPESAATPESVFLNRRALLKAMGFSAAALLPGCYLSYEPGPGEPPPPMGNLCGEDGYPAPPERNPAYRVEERCLTPERNATRFNNYYEFSTNKGEVANLVGSFAVDPWKVEVGGLCRSPRTLDLDALTTLFAPEERIYRFRCVEAWSMTVPWRGFPFARLAELVEPTAEARYVRFVTANVPDQMPGVRQRPYQPWPYTEGLRLDEALHPLTFLVTGLYGKPLPRQNGAPLRLATPWKYGYKSAKSIVRIDFVAEQPATFWNTIWPEAYSFESNVDPAVPHPSWSQSQERLIESGKVIKTLPFNGYGELVASLYA
jgi:methionine sulfoxide reductase catalytic subunit